MPKKRADNTATKRPSSRKSRPRAPASKARKPDVDVSPTSDEQGAMPSRERVHLPVIDSATGPRRRSADGGETLMRFRLASLLRLSDNLVAKAVNAYDRIFALKLEEQADIYLDMGRELAREGKNLEARQALRKAVELEPGDGRAWLELGVLHLRKRAPEAAVHAFVRARDCGQDGYRLCRHLAEALVEQGKDDEALAELTKASEFRPDVGEVHYRIGVVLDRLGRHKQAIDAFTRAIEASPKELVYHQSLGFALESAGKRKAAIKCFKRALELEQQANRRAGWSHES